jgi:selenocysteine-specific elongation factor
MNQNIAFYSQSLISEKVKRSEKEIEIALNILLNREKIRKIDNNIYISNEQVEAFINAAKYVAKKEGYIDIKNIKKFYDAPRKLLIALLEYLDRRKDFIKKENRRYLR